MSGLLQTVGLAAGYNEAPVVRGLDIEVNPGEVVALLGPNGAGKTTTLLTIAGFLKPLEGEIRLHDKPSSAPAHRRAREGMAFVTEERSVFPRLTAADNLKVSDGDPEIALAVFPELRPLLKRLGGNLSGGEQQMLTLGRALARRPKILLADELSLGLAPLVVRRLLDAVRDAAEQNGTGVLLVEQHVHQALRYADRAYVLRRGSVVLAGPVAEISGQIEEAYLN